MRVQSRWKKNNNFENKKKKITLRFWLFLRLEFSKSKAPQISGKITSGRRI